MNDVRRYGISNILDQFPLPHGPISLIAEFYYDNRESKTQMMLLCTIKREVSHLVHTYWSIGEMYDIDMFHSVSKKVHLTESMNMTSLSDLHMTIRRRKMLHVDTHRPHWIMHQIGNLPARGIGVIVKSHKLTKDTPIGFYVSDVFDRLLERVSCPSCGIQPLWEEFPYEHVRGEKPNCRRCTRAVSFP